MPNMPATSRSLATKEPERPTLEKSRNGVMGCRARVSVTRKIPSSTTAAAKAARVRRLPQPLAAALMNA